MTINAEDTKELFTGDGATLSWPFNFKVNSADDLLVFTVTIDGAEVPLTLGDDYDVELNANQNTNPGGSVVTAVPVPAGVPGVIMRSMSFTRVNEFTDSIPPHVIEEELDRLTMYALELRERLDRSLHVSAATQVFADVNLRNVQARRGKVIAFDETDRANAVLLPISDGEITGPQGVTRVSRVVVNAPAVFRQASNGDWSHTSCEVTFIWTGNGVTEESRTITIEIDEDNDCFAVPDPVSGITVEQDPGKLLTTLTATYGNVTEYFQLAVIRMAEPIYDTDTFSPAWGSGEFTSAPTGTVTCKNAGEIVTLTIDAAMVAESASSAMTWDAGTIPEDFRPSASRTAQCKLRYNNSLLTLGAATVGADGSVVFSRFNGMTGAFDASGWQTGEDKGLPADWCLTYPL